MKPSARIRRENKPEYVQGMAVKKTVPGICSIISAVLVTVFVVKSIADYTQYTDSLNSAPFSVWLLVNALHLIVPAIIVFIIGFTVKKHSIRHSEKKR